MESGKVPNHVGIILDGNRRFAKKLMLKPWKGHEWGRDKVRNVLGWAMDLGIRELTLWCFSYENFNRPKLEFEYLMKIFDEAMQELLGSKEIEEHQVQVRFIGKIEMFPKNIYETMLKIMEKTKDYKNYKLNFAMAYGGRIEILDAARRVAEKIKEGKLQPNEVTPEVFEQELYMQDKPDLIIRTGGEKRTSGFLLWQGDYAEWMFLEKMWPEFEKEDFVQCIEEYRQRERRFGR